MAYFRNAHHSPANRPATTDRGMGMKTISAFHDDVRASRERTVHPFSSRQYGTSLVIPDAVMPLVEDFVTAYARSYYAGQARDAVTAALRSMSAVRDAGTPSTSGLALRPEFGATIRRTAAVRRRVIPETKRWDWKVTRTAAGSRPGTRLTAQMFHRHPALFLEHADIDHDKIGITNKRDVPDADWFTALASGVARPQLPDGAASRLSADRIADLYDTHAADITATRQACDTARAVLVEEGLRPLVTGPGKYHFLHPELPLYLDGGMDYPHCWTALESFDFEGCYSAAAGVAGRYMEHKRVPARVEETLEIITPDPDAE